MDKEQSVAVDWSEGLGPQVWAELATRARNGETTGGSWSKRRERWVYTRRREKPRGRQNRSPYVPGWQRGEDPASRAGDTMRREVQPVTKFPSRLIPCESYITQQASGQPTGEAQHPNHGRTVFAPGNLSRPSTKFTPACRAPPRQMENGRLPLLPQGQPGRVRCATPGQESRPAATPQPGLWLP